MPRRKREIGSPPQGELLDITARLRSGPCVPALREAVRAWKAGGYKGVTDTTHILLNYWFQNDHRTRRGLPFKYHASQQEAMETLIFVWEYEKIRTRKNLLIYVSALSNPSILPKLQEMRATGPQPLPYVIPNPRRVIEERQDLIEKLQQTRSRLL